ncbi:mucin-2-like [Cydia splendana]|uniref:mucin-2-like n=1 Tax=Cydia splendana TaxID=1100963 RepID=UPI0028F47522
MSVPMASTKNYMNELFGTLLVLSALLSTASAIDCHGKSFHCVNSTHFMICVDLGGGVSQAIDNFYIACPPPTVCQGTNHFECEFPAPTTPSTISNVINETTLPWEEIITSSSLDNTKKEFSENYINTERATTVEYSVTTDTTVDVTTRTASNFYINNGLNVTEITPTIVADITTSPIETISQTISEDRSITETILTTEGVTTNVIEIVTETTAETNNPTKTDLVIAGEENNKKAININTQTTTENIDITETVTTESSPITTEQILQTTTDNPLEVDTSYLYTQLPQVLTMIQNENVTNNTLLKKSSAEKNKSTNDKGKNNSPQIGGNNVKQKKYTVDAQNAKDTTNLDKASVLDTVGNAPRSEQPKTIYEEIFTTDSTQNTEIVNLDIVTTEVIPSSNIELGTTQAPSLTLSSADTPTVDEAYTTETVQKVPTSEHPTTIYEENLRKDSTQNIETVNLDIVTTEAVNIPLPHSDVQLVTTQTPSLTQSSADTTTVDGAYTIETVENGPISKDPTTIYEENFTKDTTQNIETVNPDIVTTDPINIPFSNSDGQQVTTYAPSLITQSFADTTTLEGAFTIETVENAPSSDQPTTVNEEKIIKDSTQNIETVNLDIVITEAANIPLSNSDDQTVMTQAPSLSQNFADTTTLDGAFTIEIVENAPSSEQPTTIYEENFTRDTTQNIATVNLDVVTTEPINIPFSNSDGQQVTTYAPSLTESSTDTTILDGAYTIETVENAPSSKDPTTIYEENFTKDTTQNIETVNLDIVTTDPINIPFSNSDGQQVTTYAPSLTQSSTDTTTLDGAFTIETVEYAPSSEQAATVNEEKLIIDSTQNIETANADIVTTEAANITFSNGDDQLVMTQAPSLTQNSADTILDTVFTIETAENNLTTEQPTTINEQSLTIHTTQNIATENIIPNSKALNGDIMTTETIYQSSTMINDQSVMTEKSHVTKTTVELVTSTEQTPMLHEENRTAVTSENVASQKVPIAIGHTQSVTSKPQDPEYVKQDVTMTAEIFENGANKEQPITTNEKSSTTGTIQNVATEYNLIPTRHSVNFDITTEVVYTPTTINNDLIIQVASEDYISTKTQVLTDTTVDGTKVDGVFTTGVVGNGDSTNKIKLINKESVATDTTRSIDLINLPTETVNLTTIISNAQSAFENNMKTEGPLLPSENIVSTQEVNKEADFITAKPINIEQIIAKLPEEKLIPKDELEMAIVQTTNNNYANAEHDIDGSQQKSKTEFLGPKSESNDIPNQTYNSQKGESETIRVPNHVQYSKLQPSTVEGQDQTVNINWNPFDNYLIDKSNQNSQLTGKSDVTNLNIERNDANVVSSDTEFMPQQHIISALPATNPIPAEINTGKQSYNATTVTQRSNGFLITNRLPENIINVNSEPEVASLPTPEPVTRVKEHSTYLKTNTLASGGSVTLSSSKTAPKNAKVADTTILDITIPKLFGPISDSTVDEIGSKVKEIGSNAKVSSNKKEVDNSKNNKEATVVDTKILDNTHNIENIHNLFSPGSESTVDQTGSNVREIGSNANVSSYNKEIDYPKNSEGSITVYLSKTKLHNDKTELQTNTHDLSETINMRITTEGDHDRIDESSKPVMFNILPLPMNNVKLRPSVTNIPLLTDVTSMTQNGNIVLTTEPYQSATIYPTLVNTPIQASVNGVHNTNTPTIKNLPTLEITDKVISSKNPIFGGSTTVGNLHITKDSTFPDAKSRTGVINRGDVSPPHPLRVGQVSIGQTNTPDNNVDTISAKEQNVNETYSPQTSNANENEPQKNNSPINLSLSIAIQKPYVNTVQTLSQSVTPNPISPVTKQVANEVAIPFTCVNGRRGRYSDKDDCRKFYICVGINQPVVGNCPENTVFSDIRKLCTKNLSHCIRHNEFKCPSVGRFSDFMKDNVYYICVDHKDHLYRFKFQCQSGYIFNKTTVKCIESKEIESNESVSISSSDNSSQTGSTSAASRSINNNSVSTSRISNNSSSDDSSKTDDVSMTKNTNEEETREKSEGNEDDEEDEVFKCKKEGKFPIRNECRRFYLCKKRKSEYRRKIKKCGSGRVFDKDKKRCVDADSYEC